MDYPWIPPLCTVDIHVSSMDVHTTWDPLVKVSVDDNVTMYIHRLSLDTTTTYRGHPCIIHGCPHYLGPPCQSIRGIQCDNVHARIIPGYHHYILWTSMYRPWMSILPGTPLSKYPWMTM